LHAASVHAELPQKFHGIAGLPFFDLFPQAPFVREDLVGLACRFDKNGVSRDHAGANEEKLAAVRARISRVLRTKNLGILLAEGFVRNPDFLGAVTLVGAWILLEPSDEVALGISRGEVWRWFGASLAAGLLMIGWGVRVGRRVLRAAAKS
jgi:hypothetical protein